MADLAREAELAEGMLAGEFASTDLSDTWTQGEVYEFVFEPMGKHVRALAARVRELEAAHAKAVKLLETLRGNRAALEVLLSVPQASPPEEE